MSEYTFLQWAMFFYIYCFIGWCIESTIMSYDAKKFINRGFLRLPMLPIYGFGALTMLFAALPVKESPVLVFICSALAATLLELITGIIMEFLFKVKYWDYSNQDYNYRGIICMQSTLFWGFLALLLTYNLHKWVEKFVLMLSHRALIITVLIISILFVSDTVMSIKTAFDIKHVMAKLTAAKAELNKLVAEKVESSEKAQAVMNKIAKINSDRHKMLSKLNFLSRSQIRSHPMASSKRFAEAFKEIKESISKNKNQ